MSESAESFKDILAVKKRRLLEETFGKSDWEDSRHSFFKEGNILRHFTGLGFFAMNNILQLHGGNNEETDLSGKTPREVISIMQEIQSIRDEMVARGYSFLLQPNCADFYAFDLEKIIPTAEALKEELAFLQQKFGASETSEQIPTDEERKLLEDHFGPNEPMHLPEYFQETTKMGPLLSAIAYSSGSILLVDPQVSKKKLLTLMSKSIPSSSPENMIASMHEITRLDEVLQDRHYALKTVEDMADYGVAFEKKIDGIAALREEIYFLIQLGSQ